VHMTWAPRQRFTVRRALHWVAGGIVAAQMATMVGLVTFNGIKRRGRRPYRFPTAPTEPLKVSGHQVEIFAFGRDLYAAMIATSSQLNTPSTLRPSSGKTTKSGVIFGRHS